MKLDTFLLLLMIVSTLTGALTQGAKKALDERKANYKSNAIAGIVAVVTAVVVGIGYVIVAGVYITGTLVIYLVALVIGSWLCAMIGYDKVIQTIAQFKGGVGNG